MKYFTQGIALTKFNRQEMFFCIKTGASWFRNIYNFAIRSEKYD
jgi:hypothetical protein